MTTLVGVTSSSIARSGDKFRATWVFFGASIFPAFIYNAPDTADGLRERLPSLGFIPLSSPSALPGDETIVYDVQLSTTWGTGTPVSAIVAKLGDLPAPFTNLDLHKLEKIVTSSPVGVQAARDEGQQAATSNPAFDAIGNTLGVAGKTLALAVIVAAAVGAYVLAKKAS